MTTTTPPTAGVMTVPAFVVATEVTDLLRLAATDGLALPRSVFLYIGPRFGGRVGAASLQFPREQSSARTVSRWATRFDGEYSTSWEDGDAGRELWVETRFDWNGIEINAFAHIDIGCPP